MPSPAAMMMRERSSAEVFGSEPNSSAVRSHCRVMNRLRLGFEVPRRKSNCACFRATQSFHVTHMNV